MLAQSRDDASAARICRTVVREVMEDSALLSRIKVCHKSFAFHSLYRRPTRRDFSPLSESCRKVRHWLLFETRYAKGLLYWCEQDANGPFSEALVDSIKVVLTLFSFIPENNTWVKNNKDTKRLRTCTCDRKVSDMYSVTKKKTWNGLQLIWRLIVPANYSYYSV